MIADVGIKPAIRVGSSVAEPDESDPLSALECLPEVEVPVRSLVPGFYLRQAGTDPTHIRLLADAAASVKLPPIVVQKDGSRIIDGMHRVEAAKLRGAETINARVIDCTGEEALVLAIKTNVMHGMPLSKPDRISGAKRILAAHADWSDRAVASIAGLSAKTIASLRNRSSDDIQFHGKRLGRDGKRRPMSAAEGRRRAAEYINEHPEASLREVARQADVSLGTVHDVRERLRNGMEHCNGAERPAGAPERPSVPVKALASVPTDHRPADHRTAVGRPSSADVLGVRAARREGRPPGWSAISAKLASDPSLKYAEGGRAFLRWMASHSAQADEWRVFIDAIPAHWVGEIINVADGVSAEWREFAERLRRSGMAAG
jgi:ParB-like chromosome segregation protein Spo0J